MIKQLISLVRPTQLLLLLAALTACLLPSESSALIRQDPASGSFFASERETCRNDPVNNSDPLGLEGGNPISFLPLGGAALDFQSYGNWYTEEGYHQQTVSAAALAIDLNANIMRSALPDPKASAQLVKDQYSIASNSREGTSYRAAAGAAVVFGTVLGTLDVVTLVPGKGYLRRLLVEGAENIPEYLLRKKVSTLGKGQAARSAVNNTAIVRVGERGVVRQGEFVNRVFDSRYGELGSEVSGPLGRSFSPGSGVPTTAAEATSQRGLGIYYPNDAQEAIIYRARSDIPTINRTSLGGTVSETLIDRQYWDQLDVVRQFSLPRGTP